MLHEIVKHKRAELAALSRRGIVGLREIVGSLPPVKSLRDALLRGPGVSLIAEIKRRSPSRGTLAQSVNVAQRAELYQRAGAHAVSVLTDSRFFHGSTDDLKLARSRVSVPVLRKDFIVSEYQVYESRAIGADAILLIVAALRPEELESYSHLALSIGLEVLVEVHDETEAAAACAIGAGIIGINNRDLRTFTVDLSVTERVVPFLPAHVAIVSESGVKNAGDLVRLRTAGVHAALVGESLMTATDPAAMIGNLLRAAV